MRCPSSSGCYGSAHADSRPPLRDSKLTRILSGALGQDVIRTHLLVCVSQERQHAETSAELLSFGALAKLAKLGANVYEPSAPRALCSQLQADLATIELPNEETYNEMCDQMKPQTAQLEKLAAAAATLRAKHHQALDHMLAARNSFEGQLQQVGRLSRPDHRNPSSTLVCSSAQPFCAFDIPHSSQSILTLCSSR